MQPEHRLRLALREEPLFKHQFSATFFPCRRAFLGGLKNQHDGTRQFFLYRIQYAGSTQHHGHVVVMPTSMHHTNFLAVVFTTCHGGEWQPGFFSHG